MEEFFLGQIKNTVVLYTYLYTCFFTSEGLLKEALYGGNKNALNDSSGVVQVQELYIELFLNLCLLLIWLTKQVLARWSKCLES